MAWEGRGGMECRGTYIFVCREHLIGYERSVLVGCYLVETETRRLIGGRFRDTFGCRNIQQ